jgi:uncharacterized membrane protein YhiD involved in acid resistance
MPDALTPLVDLDAPALLLMAVRLILALALGLGIAGIYRRARPMTDESDSFTVTLVLLTVLIAMVTQVIGDNVARAFSLVGALSIVRFRTVVRDTQDTAYVIFAVAIGMAMGANHPAVALCGLLVIGFAAFMMRSRGVPIMSASGPLPCELHVRLAIGQDAEARLGPALDQYTSRRRLISIATARQGLSLDATYAAALRDGTDLSALVNALNRLDGVQNVELHRSQDKDESR